MWNDHRARSTPHGTQCCNAVQRVATPSNMTWTSAGFGHDTAVARLCHRSEACHGTAECARRFKLRTGFRRWVGAVCTGYGYHETTKTSPKNFTKDWHSQKRPPIARAKGWRSCGGPNAEPAAWSRRRYSLRSGAEEIVYHCGNNVEAASVCRAWDKGDKREPLHWFGAAPETAAMTAKL